MSKRILIVDSSAAMHRYHHSPSPPIMSKYNGKSLEVTALHRYMSYTLELSRQFDFDQLVHVLDPENGSVYRKTLFPGYKANRPPSPPEFTLQKQLLPVVLTAFGQHWIQKDGVESDDVMATLATLHAERGDLVVILTPDKDLLQMVEDGRILVARPIKDERGYRTHDYMDEAAVFKKMGVRPDQVADLLAIMNDDSDNIKGVMKAGPKTGAKWLDTYGDLQTLMTHADSITGKVGENLREALPRLPTLQKLTLVLRDVEGVSCLDEPLPPFSRTHNDQARQLIAARNHWPDRLREMQGGQSPMVLKTPDSQQVSGSGTSGAGTSGDTSATNQEQPPESESPLCGQEAPLPGDPEDPFAEDASVSSGTRFNGYSF